MRLRHPHIIALHEVCSGSWRHRGCRGCFGRHECTSAASGVWLWHVASAPPLCLHLQVFLTRTHLVLAMEYAAGGDLFRYVSARRGLPEDEARWFFQQLMVAVDYCHRMVRAAAERCCSGGCGAWGTVCAAHGWVDFPLMRPASWLSLCRRA